MQVNCERHTHVALPPAMNPGTECIGGWVWMLRAADNRTTDHPAHGHYIDWATVYYDITNIRVGFNRCNKEALDSSRSGKFLDQLIDCQRTQNTIAAGLCQYLQSTPNSVQPWWSVGTFREARLTAVLSESTTTEPRPTGCIPRSC